MKLNIPNIGVEQDLDVTVEIATNKCITN